MHPYLPHTQSEIEEMLKVIGVNSIDELFSDIPEELLLNRELKLDKSLSEVEVNDLITKLADKNRIYDLGHNYMGGGAYEHYVPHILKHLALRQEFLTAYTPYQPEISQGTLQVVFEYQSMICELTGMDASNASLYDGATAMAEAAFMAHSKNKKSNILISETVNPEYIKVVETYADYRGLTVIKVPMTMGRTDMTVLKELVDGDTSAVIMQSPNFYGQIEKGAEFRSVMDDVKNKALLIASVNPMSLGMMAPPSTYGADIVVGEGQPLGQPVQFGGPYLGFIATTKKLMRQLPGRIVGETVDGNGKRGYVLTLQAREQHIRREKATSNITSNEGLVALMATIYMALMGKQGIQEVSKACFDSAHYLYNQLQTVEGIELPYDEAFYHEFVVKVNHGPEVRTALKAKGYAPGVKLDDNTWLFCVTETKTKNQIDALVQDIRDALASV